MGDREGTAIKGRCRCTHRWACIEWPTGDDDLCDHCRDECLTPAESDRGGSVMTAMLSIGDRLEARPCVITVERIGVAHGWGICDTCETRHYINRSRFEAGLGPWRRVENGRNGDPS